MPALNVSVPPKLPVWQTVGACYATLAANLGQLARISWLWLLIMVPVYAALFSLEWGSRHETATVPTTLVQIAELPFLASIAVAWHRLILRQELITAPAYLRLDEIVVRYVLKGVVLGLLAMALWLLIVPVAAWVGLPDLAQRAITAVMQAAGLDDDPEKIALSELLVLSLAVFLLVVPRLSLVLPAVAMGEKLTLLRAWRSTRGNTLRLALATLLCLLPAYLPTLAVVWWPMTRGSESWARYVVEQQIVSVGYAILSIFAVTLLSLTYRHFTGPDSGGPPLA